MLQQPAFDAKGIAGRRAGVTSQPLSPYHAMTGNQNRDRIGAAGAANGAGSTIELPRQFAVGQHGSRWNRLQRLPNPLLEYSPA